MLIINGYWLIWPKVWLLEVLASPRIPFKIRQNAKTLNVAIAQKMSAILLKSKKKKNRV